ncbi:hypothetical protein Poli38472_014513 [Pythium oligandrum]|uniref:RIB43A-like with coiled-coils protein 2 n=1 Tax=Pythium oligandrum TaxID=41045 RepID=A0A8K1FIS5_PYTOL|nr:hypothetical protein Poli38472_014513 [Pythium oligandrum]|eukprot:TMW61052.1 hypothetical protein Poli38472_014513 [Pythium oligandrum]
MVVSRLVAGPDDKEAKLLEGRRQREQERLKKLGPGRLRTIGADIAGVKNQIEEKKRQDEADAEEQRRVDEENEAIRRYLIQVESEDALAKRKELMTLRNDWQIHAAERDRVRERDAKERAIPTDPETCGGSAAQKFHGEDPLRLERTRLQALQLKQWTLQQIEEKRQRNAMNADDEMRYANYLADIERMQQTLHEANERERAHTASEIQRFNQMLLNERRDMDSYRHESEQRANANEIQLTLQSNLVSENPLQAQLPGISMDQRVRVDHWKGFSSQQTKQYLSQNDYLLAERARHAEQHRQQEEEEARRQAELHRLLVEEEHNVQRKKTQQQLEIKQMLDKQTKEAQDREQKNAQQARGKIEPTFFQSFGRSYR